MGAFKWARNSSHFGAVASEGAVRANATTAVRCVLVLSTSAFRAGGNAGGDAMLMLERAGVKERIP